MNPKSILDKVGLSFQELFEWIFLISLFFFLIGSTAFIFDAYPVESTATVDYTYALSEGVEDGLHDAAMAIVSANAIIGSLIVVIVVVWAIIVLAQRLLLFVASVGERVDNYFEQMGDGS